MPGEVAIEYAQPGDLAAIGSLLVDANLPTTDLGRTGQLFVVARSAGTVIGCVGLETYGEAGLLRSLAVTPGHRGEGLTRALYDRLAAGARSLGVRATCTSLQQLPRHSSSGGVSVASFAARYPKASARARSLARSVRPRRPAWPGALGSCRHLDARPGRKAAVDGTSRGPVAIASRVRGVGLPGGQLGHWHKCQGRS